MKVQCIDHRDAPQQTFLIKIRQHTILFNCALESHIVHPNLRHPPPGPNQYSAESELHAILSTFSDHGKQAMDVAHAISENCDQHCVFRSADFSLVDIDSIDLVLISNHNLMLGLPFLTEYLGYKGRIIATEPTVEFARQRMEELVAIHRLETSKVEPSSSTHFSNVGMASSSSTLSNGWRTLYSAKDIASCIKRIQPVRYTETLSLVSAIRIVAHSAGYCLGSANWLLETGFKKIVLLSSTSVIPELHPAPLDTTIFNQADVILVSDLNSQPGEQATSYERNRTKALAHMARALVSKGNVVVAMTMADRLFDLIGDLTGHLKSLGIEVGPESHQVPIYAVSSMANKSLQYANICGEWMTSDRQEQLYLPAMPLIHGDLLKSGGLVVYPSISDVSMLRNPCIIFTDDPGCVTKGPIAWFVEQWYRCGHYLCLFTDPVLSNNVVHDMPPGTQMQALSAPLDARWSLGEVSPLLRTCWDHDSTGTTRHLLIPAMDGANAFKERWAVTDQDVRVHTYEPGEILHINVERLWENVSVSEKLAMTLRPEALPNGNGTTLYAPISGQLHLFDNRLELHPMTSIQDDQCLSLGHRRTLVHPVHTSTVIQRLYESGVPPSSLQVSTDTENRTTITLPSDMGASLVIENDATIIRANDEQTRIFLRDLVTQQSHANGAATASTTNTHS